MHTTEYTPPVDKLLTYTPLQTGVAPELPNYTELGIGPEQIPELIRMATDTQLFSEGASDEEFSAPYYALRLLGEFQAKEAIEPLLSLFASAYAADYEWILDTLPFVYAQIGPSALPALAAYVADLTHGSFPMIYAGNAIAAIGEKYPEVRLECIDAITKRLEHFDTNDEEDNGSLIADLIQLKAVEAAPLIKRAFDADTVETFIVGDWDEVQVQLGLKEREERQPLQSLPQREPLSHVPDPSYYRVNPPSKQEKAKKAKAKMAKASRKKNRRK